MLLSYRKPVSRVVGRATPSPRRPSPTRIRAPSGWPQRTRPGATLTIDLGAERELRALQVNYADYDSRLFAQRLHASTRSSACDAFEATGARWTPIADLTGERRDRPTPTSSCRRPCARARCAGSTCHVGAAHLAVSDVRVFGSAGGRRPRDAGRRVRRAATPTPATRRSTWRAGAGRGRATTCAGASPRRSSIRRTSASPTRLRALELRALNVGQPYDFAVEAFNENGVSPASAPVHLP